jgi:hypothetical protein
MAAVKEAVTRPEAGPSLASVSGPQSSRAFLITLALFLLFIEAAAQLYLLPNHVADAMDFRQLYTAGYMLRTEPAHLYDIQRQVQVQAALTDSTDGVLPFNHTAFEAAFFVPLSYLTYSAAYRVILAINVLLIAVCFFSMRSLFSYPIPIWQPRPGLLFFPFVAVAVVVMHGQDSLLFLAICCIALNLLLREQDFLAGGLLAITLFKPQFTLPLAVLLMARRGWRFLGGFLTGSALIFLLCLHLVHISGLRAFLHIIAFTNAAGQHPVTLSYDPNGSSPLNMPNLHGLLFFSLLRWLPSSFGLPIMIAVSIAALGWAVRQVRIIPDNESAFAYALAWAVLLSYLSHFADLALWIIPMAVLARRAEYPKREFLLLQGAFLLPALLIYLIPDPTPWMWALSLPLLATALYLGRFNKHDATNRVLLESPLA